MIRIGKTEDPFHDVSYVNPTDAVRSGKTIKTSNCGYCLSLFDLIRRKRDCVRGSSPGFDVMCDDVGRKVQPLLEPMIRCKVQKDGLVVYSSLL